MCGQALGGALGGMQPAVPRVAPRVFHQAMGEGARFGAQDDWHLSPQPGQWLLVHDVTYQEGPVPGCLRGAGDRAA